MYIWTEEQQILNLDHYKRVDIVSVNDSYWLSAYETPKDTARDPYGIRIARFNNEVDAMYARCLLFKCLMDHAGAWDATAVPLLSDIWQSQKNCLASNIINSHRNFIYSIEISITGLDAVTLRYEKRWEQHLGSNIENYKKEVEEQLQCELSMDVKWKVIEEEK